MTDRSIVLKLKAEISDFKRQMADAKKAAQGVGDESEASAKRSKTGLGQMVQSASKNEEAWTRVGSSLLGIGAAAAAGVGIAISKFADFDQAMSHVQAATHETAASMELLRAAAIEAGASTQYSATEAAGAIENLAKAGVSTTDILEGGLDGALSLAAAGSIDVADAAEIAATALTQFGLEGKDVTHVADLLAAGAGKAQGGVGDLGMALKQAGLVADQTGLSIEETTGGLSAFASAGLIGSDAGTSFKAMLQRLTPQSKEAQRAMDDLGISAYDSQGQFIGLAEFAGNLEAALKHLTPEQRNSTMATIFGSDAVRAANVLYEQGESGIRGWISAVDDAGYAAETAALNTDNLRGDVERLGGALDTALIKTGESADGILRKLTQSLTGMIDAYGSASPTVQNFTLVGGAAVAAVGLLGGGFLVLAPRIIATRAAMAVLATDMPKTTAAMKGLGKAAGTLGVALTALVIADMVVTSMSKTAASTEKTTEALLELGKSGESLDAIFTSLGKNFNLRQIDGLAGAVERLTNPTMMDRLNDFSGEVLSLGGRDGAVERDAIVKQFNAIGDSLGSMVSGGHAEVAAEQFDVLSEAWVAGGGAVEDLEKMLPGYTDALAGAANQQTLAGESASGMAEGVAEVDPAIGEAKEALDEWMAATMEADQSFINLGSAYDLVIEKNTNLAQSTADETDKASDSWNDYYDGVSVSAAEYIAQLQAQVDAQAAWETNLVELATRAREGMTGEMQTAAFQMIEELKALGPEGAAEVQLLRNMTDAELAQVVTLYREKGASAAAEFAEKLRAIQNPVIRPTVDPTTAYAQLAELQRRLSTAAGQNVVIPYSPQTHPGSGRADGGMIYGPGSGTSDDVPIWASNGEYVIKAATVAQQPRAYWDNLNAGRFATGGPVGTVAVGGGRTGVDPTALAGALSGMTFVLEIDGQPVRAIARAEAVRGLRTAAAGRGR